MSESMRGMRLGSQSLESDVGIELSARQLVSFRCPNQHQFNLVFAENVELPELWQCQQCQALATRMIDGEILVREQEEEDGVRSHYDMVKERRTEEELEELLQEMLTSMRRRRSEGQLSA
jgi:hypothetical protein